MWFVFFVVNISASSSVTRFSRPLFPLLPLTVIALVAALVLPRCMRQAAPPAAPETTVTQAPSAVVSPSPPATTHPADRPALRRVEPSATFPRSPLADALNTSATTVIDDLRTIGQMLALYRERFDAYPAFGDNVQLVNALAGSNPHRIGLLPRDTPAVSPATGELLDRWGTPYLFHAISRHALEIRSVGPDRTPYTADDVVLPIGDAVAPAP